MSKSRKFFCGWLAAFGLIASLSTVSLFAADAKATAKIDLNKATEEELMELPGVGDVTAKKIIAGRPFTTVDDLAKVGVKPSTIEKISAHVTQGRAAAAAAKPATPAPAKDEKVDVNSATAQELEELPGIGEATAKKIIAARPLKTEADLIKAGVTKKTADKIASMIEYGAAGAAAKPATPDAKTDTKTVAKTTKPEDVEAKVPPVKGMVWVNTESKVYHVEGDRWYGKTKKGEVRTEEDAIKAGAHKSKQD